MPSSAAKSNVLVKPNVTKKRSTTDPSVSTERTSNSRSEVAEKKKKSKVATLRSKFSFKDMGKEYRKDVPPLSSMPKLGGGSGTEIKRAFSDGESQSKKSHNFNEAKLYVPKTRTNDDGAHPQSAPPQTSEFRDSSLDNSEDSIVSCPSMETPRKASEGEKTEPTFKHSLVHNTDDSQSTTNTDLETLLLGGPSPPSRTGECKNTGQPELIQVQDRVASMKAENKDLALPSSPSSRPTADAREYSPTGCGTPCKVAVKASKSSLLEKESQKTTQPFIVHSHPKENGREEQADDHRFLDPREPPAVPAPALPSRSRAREAKATVAVDDKQVLTGVTSHGGYAPPPPHPGYQNTVTLEQQLASHVDSLHYHVSTAVNKLTRTFEDGSNWSTDQIMKRVEDMFDSVRLLEGQANAQEKTVKDLQQQLMNTQAQIAMALHETLLVEKRMKAFVQGEMAKLKDELIGLMISSTGVARTQDQIQDVRLYQGPQGAFRSDKRYQHQNKKKQRQMQLKRDEISFNRPTDNKSPMTGQNQESKPAPVQRADTSAGRAPDQKIPSNGVPTPTAAFRPPKPQTDDTLVPIKHEGPADPGEELLGSPREKAHRMPVSNPMPCTASVVAESSKSQPIPERESASCPRNALSGDFLKTPKKKGGMFSGFRRDKDKKGDGDNRSSGYRLQIRTPRRTRETNCKPISSSQDGQQSPHIAIPTLTESHAAAAGTSVTSSTTTTAPIAAGADIRREDSPSLVHPALRDPHQKQIMANREQLRLAHLNRQLQNPAPQQPGHGHPLRISQSYQSLGNRDSTSSAAPASSQSSFVPYEHLNHPGYASGISVSTSSSMSSFQNVRHYQSHMHYPHPSPPQGPGTGQLQYFAPHLIHPNQDPHHPLPDHGYGPGQFDGTGWQDYGNGY
ncbi:uncharacterized protein BDV17DRAFT_288480 [Aspergillus undulatus]|uniref:uncharacterized protein n=1 Tax=Aspergillus undulatus TaxID=1810928 RepID=UPI003CCDEAFE